MDDDARINQKPVAVVTGASRGIGKATSILLQNNGFAVVGVYRKEDTAADVMRSEHGVAMIKADVSDVDQVQSVINNIISEYGQLDAVVNNAAIDLFGPIEHYDVHNWHTMLNTDVSSIFYMCKFAIPHLKDSPIKAIINVSSRLGLLDQGEANFVVYSTVKAAVNSFSTTLAKELQPVGIRVNVLIPVPTETDLLPEVYTADEIESLRQKGRLGTPIEAAELIMQGINGSSMSGQIIWDPRLNPSK